MTGRAWTDDDRTVEFDDELLAQPGRDDPERSGSGWSEATDDDDRWRDDRPPHWE